jgi:hypothetical protein
MVLEKSGKMFVIKRGKIQWVIGSISVYNLHTAQVKVTVKASKEKGGSVECLN